MKMFLTLKITCPVCHKQSVITAKYEDVKRWINGELIQRALPYLSQAKRETFISGLCAECQKIF